MSVRVRSKSLLLTYPHCDLTNEDIRERLLANKTLELKGVKYMVVAKEFHQDGEEHHHVYIQCEEVINLNRNQMNIFDLIIDNRSDFDVDNPQFYHPNIQSVRSPKDAIDYVKKNNQYITYGVCPYKEIMSTKEKNKLYLETSLKSLVENGQISIFKMVQLEKARTLFKNESTLPKFEKKFVYWYWGETGSGKTKEAWRLARDNEECEEDDEAIDERIWYSNGDGKWFDGYHGQGTVIIDDLRSNTWEFSWLLRLTDSYPVRVPIKGGFVRWQPKVIIITAPDEPRVIYSNHQTAEPYDGIEQLERRITEIRYFEKPKN